MRELLLALILLAGSGFDWARESQKLERKYFAGNYLGKTPFRATKTQVIYKGQVFTLRSYKQFKFNLSGPRNQSMMLWFSGQDFLGGQLKAPGKKPLSLSATRTKKLPVDGDYWSEEENLAYHIYEPWIWKDGYSEVPFSRKGNKDFEFGDWIGFFTGPGQAWASEENGDSLTSLVRIEK